jgi:hypothetical protein
MPETNTLDSNFTVVKAKKHLFNSLKKKIVPNIIKKHEKILNILKKKKSTAFGNSIIPNME